MLISFLVSKCYQTACDFLLVKGTIQINQYLSCLLLTMRHTYGHIRHAWRVSVCWSHQDEWDIGEIIFLLRDKIQRTLWDMKRL